MKTSLAILLISSAISIAQISVSDNSEGNLSGTNALRVDSNSLVNGRMADPDYLYNPSNTLTSKIPNFFYDETHGWMDYLNPDGAAPTSGLAICQFIAPANGTITVTLPVRLPPGVSSTGQFRLFVSSQNLGTILASQTLTLTSTTQVASITFSATSGTNYAVGAFLNNSGQCKALTGALKVSCSGSSGTLLDSSFNRIAIRPSEINGKVTYLRSYPHSTIRTNALAFVRIITDAASIVLEGTSTIYGSYPTLSTIGIFVDGILYKTVTLNPSNPGFLQQISVPLPAGKKVVTLVNGAQSSPAGTIIGAWVRAIYVPSSASTTMVTPTSPGRRVATYGDSITTGSAATNLHANSAWSIIRNSGRASVFVDAYGYRSLFDDTPAGIVSTFQTFDPTDIYLAIGTNDYGLSKQSATSFGVQYAALVDALHTAYPSAAIYAQTPLIRSSEPPNSYGDNLEAYRAAIEALAESRPWLNVIDGASILTAGVLPDGTHPNDLGHGKWAESIFTNLNL
jgi:lysophospholipase L1-like esterase